jgi:L-lactate dehydrogenase
LGRRPGAPKTKGRQNMRKVAVIGMGNVGAAVAHQLIVGADVDELALYDINEGKVNADALDFRDAMANLPNHVSITVNDWSQLSDAQVIISTLGKISLITGPDAPKNDRFAELRYSRKAIRGVCENIRKSGFNGVIVVVSNPCDIITALYQQETGLPKEHVMGTGTLLDSARLQRIVAEKLGVDPRSVTGYVLGEHGNSQFTAWSTVRVLGRPFADIAAEHHLDLPELEDEARKGGFTIANGKHYTNYGVAAAAVRLVNAIESDSHEVLPVSDYREKYGVYMSYPAVVGRGGILDGTDGVARVELPLTDEETGKLARSARFIKEKVAGSETA